MTAKEFVLQKYPDAGVIRYKNVKFVVFKCVNKVPLYVLSDNRLSVEETETRAWVAAKNSIKEKTD